LGTKLLDRTSRSVELTSAGHVLLEEARRVLAASERAEAATRNAGRGEAGWLRVGVVGSVAFGLAPRLLREFRARYDKVELQFREMTTAVQLEALRDGALDVGIVRQLEDHDDLETVVLEHEPLVAVVPSDNRLAAQPVVSLAQLADENFVYLPRDRLVRMYDHMSLLFQSGGAQFRVTEEVYNFPQIIGIVAAGIGVSVVPSCVQVFRPQNVVYLPIDDPGAVSTVSLVYRPQPPVPTRERFVELSRSFVRAEWERTNMPT
jgi:DNA-binding transcriptional LysR family regulator